ncbi:MAG: hypothetical protein Q8O76_15025, partial [Chloroflexota bacterium]|nr:hypothetical protein [Chloroflexota bacterium]
MKLADASSRYEIQTPSASALVRGTLFTTMVEPDGTSRVETAEGAVGLKAEGTEVLVGEGTETGVPVGEPPAPPSSSPAPKNQLVIILDDSGILSVTGPNGGSAGVLPDGTAFNTIPGARVSRPGVYPQTITIPIADEGDYRVVVRGEAGASPRLTVRGISEGRTVLESVATLEMGTARQLSAPVSIEARDGKLIQGSVGEAKPFEGLGPERIVPVKASASTLQDRLVTGLAERAQQVFQASGRGLKQAADSAAAAIDASGIPGLAARLTGPKPDDQEVAKTRPNPPGLSGAPGQTNPPGQEVAATKPNPPGLSGAPGQTNPPGQEVAA